MQENLKQNITPKKEKSSFTKGFIEQLELIVIFFAVIIVIFSFMCKSCVVVGDSMLNTLQDNDRVLIWDLLYTPKRGDIVVIHDPEKFGTPIVKRVIGLPGDTVYVEHKSDHMKVTVTNKDGTKIDLFEDEQYVFYDSGNKGVPVGLDGKWTVADGEVFVMGDNRLNSQDSRMEGCFDSRMILGKVIFRMTPLNKMGIVK